MNLFVITLSLCLAANKGSLAAAKDNIRENKSTIPDRLVDRAVERNPIPSNRLIQVDPLIRIKFKHDGHCAKGWMGDNIWVNSVEECAETCRDRDKCGYFAYDADSFSYYNNCATYLVVDGCPYDGRYPKFRSYELNIGPEQVLDPDNPRHSGHCARGWMGDNRNVDKLENCGILCLEREGCRYFSYDESNSYATNCATYWGSGQCPNDYLFPEFESYEIEARSGYLRFDFFQNGVCASGWMSNNRKVESIIDCANICSDRTDCKYFAYDASNSYDTNCATYFVYDGCPQGGAFWGYDTYETFELIFER